MCQLDLIIAGQNAVNLSKLILWLGFGEHIEFVLFLKYWSPLSSLILVLETVIAEIFVKTVLQLKFDTL